MSHRLLPRLLAASACLLGAACLLPTETATADADGRILGALEHYGDPVQVEIPTVVSAGEPFTVTVTTYGGGCVAKGEMEVEQSARRAVLRPYDVDIRAARPSSPVPNVCTTVLLLHRHEAELRFSTPGVGEVVIWGRRAPSDEVFRVRRFIEVR